MIFEIIYRRIFKKRLCSHEYKKGAERAVRYGADTLKRTMYKCALCGHVRIHSRFEPVVSYNSLF